MRHGRRNTRSSPTSRCACSHQREKATSLREARRRRAGCPGNLLIEIARANRRDDALAEVERWKEQHPEVAAHLESADILVDAMRGRSSTWTRVRVNLKNVPEALRQPLLASSVRRRHHDTADAGDAKDTKDTKSTKSTKSLEQTQSPRVAGEHPNWSARGVSFSN